MKNTLITDPAEDANEGGSTSEYKVKLNFPEGSSP